MGYTAMDKTVSLIHKWCKENNLPETCKTLEEEYQTLHGKGIKDPVDSSLKKIIETHQHFKLLISSFINVDASKATAAVRSRKISESKDTCESSQTDSDAVLKEKKTKKKKKEADGPLPEEMDVPKKKKKEPFMPPNTWVCPEMESTLYGVYDRQPALNLSIISTDEAIDNHDENILVEELPVNMFTSDSEQDSDDNNNNTVLKTTIIEAVKQTPVKTKKVEKIAEQSNSDTSKQIDDTMPDSSKKAKRKRRKSKKLLAHTSPVYEGKDDVVPNSIPMESTSISTEVDVSAVVEKVEKKKKKKKAKLDVEENKSSVESVKNLEISEEMKIKGVVNPEDPSASADLEMMNGVPPSTVKKEKKKKKKKIVNEDFQTPVSIDHKSVQEPVQVEQETIEHDVLSDLSNTLKKKKKKKKVLDIGS